MELYWKSENDFPSLMSNLTTLPYVKSSVETLYQIFIGSSQTQSGHGGVVTWEDNIPK